MLIDARRVAAESTLDADLCIIGAGAAGIAIAREWLRERASVLLLEGGGFAYEPEVQSLYAGRARGTFLGKGSSYLLDTRLRFFGGTTNHWAGFCRPMDPIDFETRPWVPESGWPIGRGELDPYYRRALPILDLEPFDVPGAGERPRLVEASERIETIDVHLSSPTRVGAKYRDEIVGAERVSLLLRGSGVELVTRRDGTAVSHLRVACLSGNRFSVRARAFVLATGGIENARLLLLSRSAHPEGLGNQNDLVGRYFMDHIAMSPGRVLVTRSASALAGFRAQRDEILRRGSVAYLATTASVQRELGLLGFSARLQEPEAGATPLEQALGRAAAEMDGVAPAGATRRRLRVVAEPAPHRESRVTLGPKPDPLGAQRARLDWRVQASDYASIAESLRVLARELGRVAGGRVKLEIQADEGALAPSTEGGAHHMGTTRMHADPRRGVVDANCGVHGVANLYVAGSSVFPTVGTEGTTTLTLVALALRLSDHLKRRLAP